MKIDILIHCIEDVSGGVGINMKQTMTDRTNLSQAIQPAAAAPVSSLLQLIYSLKISTQHPLHTQNILVNYE